MPYNNTPIAPPSEFTGTGSLPLARVKKIIAADEDIGACSANAAFAIAIATEMFTQHLVEQTYNVVKSERKPRRNVQYRDVASAVARLDNLEFLSDVVPRTMTYKQYKEKKAAKEAGTTMKASEQLQVPQQRSLPNGQRTLDQMTGSNGRRAGAEPSGRGRQQRQSLATEEEGDETWDADEDAEMGGTGQRRQDDEEEQEFAGYREGNAQDLRYAPHNSRPSQVSNLPLGGPYVRVEVPMRGPAPQPAEPSLTSPTAQRQDHTRTRGPLARHAYDAVRDRFDT